MNNILLAIDFSDDHSNALLVSKAKEMASAFGAKIWVIHITAPDPDFAGFAAGPQSERDIRADHFRNEHKLVQQIADEIKSGGIDAEVLLVQGPTVETMLEQAEKIQADLLMVSYVEHGVFHKMFQGSTTLKIIRKAKFSILVVPSPEVN